VHHIRGLPTDASSVHTGHLARVPPGATTLEAALDDVALTELAPCTSAAAPTHTAASGHRWRAAAHKPHVHLQSPALAVAVVVVDTIPDFLIRPYVSGNRTHVGLLMFAYILGPIAFGFYGIFLGPILLVLFAQFFRTVAPYVLSGETTGRQTTFETFEETTSSEPAFDE
jgi:hypothetical protein